MMKGILYPVVMCLVAFTALGHATEQITNDESQYAAYQTLSPEATRAVDSLSIALGDLMGIGAGMSLLDSDSDIDIAQVTKAINQIVYCQEGKDYISGMEFGVMIAQMLHGIRTDSNINLNKQLLLEHLKAELLTENPLDESAISALGERIDDLFEQINSNSESQNDALTDSLSSAVGTNNGSYLRLYIDIADTDLEQVLKGIEYATEQESDESFLTGTELGIHFVQVIDKISDGIHMPLNKDLVMEHLISGLSVKDISEEEYTELYQQIDPLVIRATELSPEAIANKKAGEAYMEQLRKDKSFKFTKSGLAYRMLKQGKGKKFTEDDVVNTIYVCKHLDGTEFDSSEGDPIPLGTNEVIDGFSEMLQLMKPGGKAIVVIPGNLAYGLMGTGDIGPNETLIFEFETVDRQQ